MPANFLQGRQSPDAQGTFIAHAADYTALTRLLRPSTPLLTPEKQKAIIVSGSARSALKRLPSPNYKQEIMFVLFVSFSIVSSSLFME